MSDLLEAALRYADRGWPVFPCRDKRPLVAHGLHDATTDEATIRRWWGTWPTGNVAVVTGAGSGLVVLDVDGDDGADALQQLEREHGELPDTVEALTGRGRHVFFKYPGTAVRNSAGRLGVGLDTRSEGGYVIVSPSRHESGRSYEWAADRSPDDVRPAELPGWLLALLTPAASRNGHTAAGEKISQGKRNTELTSLAGSMRRRGMGAQEIRAALSVTNQTRCEPPLSERELDQIVQSVARYEPATALPRSDLETAYLLAAEHGEHLRHCRERKMWLAWDGTRWRRDATGEAQRAAKQTAHGLLDRAGQADDKAALKWAVQARAEHRIRAALTLAETEPEIALAAEQLDSDPWLLTCANGTLDLRDGRLRGHDPGQLITLSTAVSYDPNAACPRWRSFLREVFADDDELISFLQRFTGYCLTGDVREHVLCVLHGAGRNGKSTFLHVLQQILGDHAVTARLDAFLRARGDRGPRNDLAALHRARLVSASESGEGRRLDEPTLKELTGGDRISARFLYGEFFSFTPMFKLLIVTNHRPRVDGDDDAIWARLKLIPFEVSFSGREDKDLTAKLDNELPGILTWAVEGCMSWQREGLGTAAAVTRATDEYRRDEDILGAFLDQCCELSGEVEAAKLRSAYERYCEDLGEKPLSGNILGKRLARRGIKKAKRAGTYRGVHLR